MMLSICNFKYGNVWSSFVKFIKRCFHNIFNNEMRTRYFKKESALKILIKGIPISHIHWTSIK